MICDQYLRPSLYLSKLDVVLYEITKPSTVPRLQAVRQVSDIKTKEHPNEHREQGTCYTQIFFGIAND